MTDLTFENDAILFLDGNRGIYIPKDFAITIKHEFVTGVTDEDWAVLKAGPHAEDAEPGVDYWDTWADVEANAVIDWDGIRYHLHQDGDLFLVLEGCEIPEM